MIWLQFIAASAFICYFGIRFSKSSEIIADLTGLGQSIVGLLLVSVITSLPELTTSSTATYNNSVNISYGNIFGSNMFNTMLLAAAMIVAFRTNQLNKLERSHIKTANNVLLISMLIVLNLIVYHLYKITWLTPVVFIFMILFFLYFNYETFFLEQAKEKLSRTILWKKYHEEEEELSRDDLKKAWFDFILSGLVIVAAGIWLAFIGDQIAVVMNWGKSFVGFLFVAFATSLPELVVTVTLLKRKSYNLIIGDVVGSNVFNLIILPVSALFYQGKEPLVTQIESVQILTGIFSIIIVILSIGALYFPRKDIQSLLNVNPEKPKKSFLVYPFLIIFFYFICNYVIFQLSQ